MDLKEIAVKVASELGLGWAADQVKEYPAWDNLSTCITHADGRGFYLNEMRDEPTKIHIYGIYPKTRRNGCWAQDALRGNDSKPTINVSSTKTPKQIAGDITRRFLPEYGRILAKAIELKTNSEQYARAGATLLNDVSNAIGINVSAATEDPHVYLSTSDVGWGTIKTNDTDVSIELRSLPPAIALRLCTVLREEREKAIAAKLAKEIEEAGGPEAYAVQQAEYKKLLEEMGRR